MYSLRNCFLFFICFINIHTVFGQTQQQPAQDLTPPKSVVQSDTTGLPVGQGHRIQP
jgi:hypothetical protein